MLVNNGMDACGNLGLHIYGVGSVVIKDCFMVFMTYDILLRILLNGAISTLEQLIGVFRALRCVTHISNVDMAGQWEISAVLAAKSHLR